MTGLTPTTSRDLVGLVELLGIGLQRHRGGRPGWYDNPSWTISLRDDLSPGLHRSVLAHEITHALYRDEATTPGHFTAHQERRADRYALTLLFSDEQFRDAYLWCGPHVPALADELCCSQAHVSLYMTLKKDHP